MRNVKDDAYYIGRLKKDMDFITAHMKDKSEADFADDEVLQDSMCFRLIQISENARKLTDGFRARRADVPWGDVYGLRNRIVHDYGTVDLRVVYVTLVRDIPLLAAALEG